MVVLVYNFSIINDYFTQIRFFDVHYEEVYKYKKFIIKNIKIKKIIGFNIFQHYITKSYIKFFIVLVNHQFHIRTECLLYSSQTSK